MVVELKSMENPKPFDFKKVMGEIAADMEKKVQLRFRNTKGPDGKKWKPLSKVTISRRRKKSSKPLNDTGKTKGSFASKHNQKYAVVGSNYKIVPTHQFGAKKGQYRKNLIGTSLKTRKSWKINIPWGDVPARPMVGFSNRQAKSYLKKISEANIGKKVVIKFK